MRSAVGRVLSKAYAFLSLGRALIALSYTAAQYAVVFVAVFFSAIVSAVAGFGFGLMSVPLISLAIPLHPTVIVASLLGLTTNVIQSYRYRRSANLSLVKRLCVGAVVGMPFGFAVFSVVSDTVLRLILGVAVLIAVAVLARGLDLTNVGPSFDFGTGFLSGVLNTSISTNGPPLVFGLQARKLEPEPFRATLSLVFAVSGIVGLALFVAGGKVHADELVVSAIALPALALGLLAGFPLRYRFSAERFRLLVFALLIVAAVAAIAKAFT
ncbi:MAG: sulfite exporter TauE/SafE family protein [Actinomycetota bacterium]